MNTRAELISHVLETVAQQGVETLRICFVDQHGILRGKTVVAGALETAFEKGIGIPSTLLLKDTSNSTVFPVWTEGAQVADLPLAGAGDVLIRPDPARFFILPWSPHSAVLLCDVIDRSGAAVPFASGAVLAKAVADLDAAGYQAVFGLEVEFQVFHLRDAALGHDQATMPPAPVQTSNLTQGHQYLSETRYSEAQDLLDDLRRHADALALEPRSRWGQASLSLPLPHRTRKPRRIGLCCSARWSKRSAMHGGCTRRSWPNPTCQTQRRTAGTSINP